MKRIFLSAGAAVLQMVALGMMVSVKNDKAILPEHRYEIPARFRKKRGPVPNRPGRTTRAMPQLIVDRASSFKKMRRAINFGAVPPQPDERELMRHGWYRRKLRKEAEQQEAA